MHIFITQFLSFFPLSRVAFSLGRRLPMMPQATMSWRLESWLRVGSARATDSRLASIHCRTLIVAGTADAALPSASEAERLSKIFRDCAVATVPGAGHSATCGSRCDLTALLRHRFEELQGTGLRTSMKEGAVTAGFSSHDFGLITRTHPSVSPFDYWSKGLYFPAN